MSKTTCGEEELTEMETKYKEMNRVKRKKKFLSPKSFKSLVKIKQGGGVGGDENK